MPNRFFTKARVILTLGRTNAPIGPTNVKAPSRVESAASKPWAFASQTLEVLLWALPQPLIIRRCACIRLHGTRGNPSWAKYKLSRAIASGLASVFLGLSPSTLALASSPQSSDQNQSPSLRPNQESSRPNPPTQNKSQPRPAHLAQNIHAVNPRSLRPIHMRHIHRGRSINLALFDTQGRASREGLKQLREFLACHKTGVDHPIHWRVISILLAVGHRWPGRTILIYSGYRHPKVSHNAKRSKHTRGRAIDFRVEGVPNRVLFESLRASFSDIGVGYYPNSHFVHLDIREHDGLWVDYAAPGRRACYSPNARKDLLDGSADALNDSKARQRGCKGHDRRDLDRDTTPLTERSLAQKQNPTSPNKSGSDTKKDAEAAPPNPAPQSPASGGGDNAAP